MHWSFISHDHAHAKVEAFSRGYCTTLCRGSNAQDAPPLSKGIMGQAEWEKQHRAQVHPIRKLRKRKGKDREENMER